MAERIKGITSDDIHFVNPKDVKNHSVLAFYINNSGVQTIVPAENVRAIFYRPMKHYEDDLITFCTTNEDLSPRFLTYRRSAIRVERLYQEEHPAVAEAERILHPAKAS